MRAVRPPGLLEGLLRTLIGGESLTIVGDLREEFAGVRARWPWLVAALWYALQVVLVGSRLGVEHLVLGWGSGDMISSIVQDLRYGVRSLMGAPLFTLVSVVTLALGVGATTAIYSVVYGVLVDPLPFAEPGRLVELGNNTGGQGWYGSSPAQFLDYEEQLENLASVGGYVTGVNTVGDTLQPRRVEVAFVSQGTWPTLGVVPLRGRVFTPEEDVRGGNAVVVLSEGFWRSEFGADPGILGRTIYSNGNPAEVIGVMPSSFTFPRVQTTMWFPFQINRGAPNRSNHFIQVVGRLGEGRSIDEAGAELAALAARSVEMYPENYSERGFRTRIIPLHEAIVGDVRSAILIAFAAGLMVLLIASVNIANLVLARGESRGREVAIRSALGAGRLRVTRQLLTEGVLLAFVGGVLGVAVAVAGVAGLVTHPPGDAPRFENIAVNGPVLGLAVLLVGASVLFFGAWPAVRATGVNLRGALSAGDRSAVGQRGQGIRRSLVISQVALAAMLAVSAGVVIRSLGNLYAEERGFSADAVMTFRVDLPGSKYQTSASRVTFYDELVNELQVAPGIGVAAAATRLPLLNTYDRLSLQIGGRPEVELGAAPDAFIQVATHDYFATMGIGPSQGRLYTEFDNLETPLVTVVNETMARQLFPGEEALGQRVRMWTEGYPFMEIVGVIPDVKELQIASDGVSRMYIPYAQTEESAYSTPGGMFVAMTAQGGNPLDLMPTARRIVQQMDPAVPISSVNSMQTIIASSLATELFARMVLQIFGIVAIVLACVGVYGVLSVSVSQRIPEIGLRKALGARSEEVFRAVVSESAVLAVVGVAVGIGLALLVTRWMESLLFGVSTADPLTLVSVAAVIGFTALVAAAVPALRASRVDPMVALKGR